MGTMPVSECRRRSRNELPSPARKGATPGLILGATELADATMGSYVSRYEFKRTAHYRCALEYKSREHGSLLHVMADTWRRVGPIRGQKQLIRSTRDWSGTNRGMRETRRHGGCSGIFLRRLVRRTSCRLREIEKRVVAEAVCAARASRVRPSAVPRNVARFGRRGPRRGRKQTGCALSIGTLASSRSTRALLASSSVLQSAACGSLFWRSGRHSERSEHRRAV